MAEKSAEVQDSAAASAPQGDGGHTRLPSDTGTGDVTETPDVVARKADGEEFGGLFGDEEKQSEDDLKGESPKEDKEPEGESSQEKEEPKKEEGSEEKKAADSEPKDEPKAEEKKEQEKKEEPKEGDKPPKGYVPQQALTEARGQNKALKEQLNSLQAEINTLKAKPQEPAQDESEWKDFKVMSKKELDDLIDEDPSEALKYQARLIEYKDWKKEKAEAEKEKAESTRRMQSMVTEWTNKIAEAVPGIYEEGSEVGVQLADFAVEMGFDDATYLEAMTDPRTLITPHGQNQSYLIGPGAAGLIKLLSNAKSKVASTADRDSLRKEIEKEIRPQIIEQVTKELTDKIKGTGKSGYKSLSSVPGGGEDVATVGRKLTEEEWAKKPPEEREKLLMGE
jgi:hypothetical protein